MLIGESYNVVFRVSNLDDSAGGRSGSSDRGERVRNDCHVISRDSNST